jgi:hypothetical protein
MTKEDVKSAILEVAGNPVSGIIFEMADAFADAVIDLSKPAKEVRITQPKETR